MTIVEAARGVTGGVDTHLDVHVAAALDRVEHFEQGDFVPRTEAS